MGSIHGVEMVVSSGILCLNMNLAIVMKVFFKYAFKI